jgi:hypothetical protein
MRSGEQVSETVVLGDQESRSLELYTDSIRQSIVFT